MERKAKVPLSLYSITNISRIISLSLLLSIFILDLGTSGAALASGIDPEVNNRKEFEDFDLVCKDNVKLLLRKCIILR